MADGFKVADAYVEIHGDKSTLKKDIADLPNAVGPDAERAGSDVGKRVAKGVGAGAGPGSTKAGKDSGDKLSQGMQLAIIRNSPLIAAAIGGALAAGAPVAIAGATALFAGIGVVAAAQSDAVRQAWVGTWDAVKTGAIQDAGVLVPALTSAAAQITRAFQQMRPELQDAFGAIAPQVNTFTESITRAAQNAMPGFVSAVKASGPVMDGLGNLVESVGTGIDGFFTRISGAAPAAGSAFSSLGGAVGNLLPILGDLLSTGAEVASTFLPMLSGSLGVLKTVLDAVGPAAPALTAGIGGWKVGQLAAGWLGSAAGAVGKVGDAMGGSEEGAGAFSSALSFVGDNAESLSEKAGPILGAAIGALSIAMQMISDQANEWAGALREGGNAADDARSQMNALKTALDTSQSGWAGTQAAALNFTAAGGMAHAMLNQTTEALKAQWEAMSPLQQAQSKVAEWTKTLADRLQDEGANAESTQIAFQRLQVWTDKEAEAQRQLEMATKGVTQAMIDQDNAARGRVDAQFAYQNALNSTEDATQALADAQAHLNDADENTRTSQEDVERAALQLQEAYKAQADAAEDAATTNLPASMDDNQKAIIGAKAALDELNKLMAQGVVLSPTLEAYRQKLMGIVGQTDTATLAQSQLTSAIGELGFAVDSVPGEKYITIDAPTDELTQKLDDLGFTITYLPDGSVTVEAKTDEAKANLGNLSTLLAGIGSQTPTATPAINDGPFMSAFNGIMGVVGTIGAQHPTPTADINHGPFDIGHGAIMGNIATLANQRPTPVAAINAGPFSATFNAAMSNVATLASQRPTPTAAINAGPFSATFNAAMSNIATLAAQSPRPTVSIQDNASGPLSGIFSKLASIVSKTVTVTTVAKNMLAAGGPVTKAASGRVVGPGTSTSDSVPAIGPGGAPWALSNNEWVINARVAQDQGDARMAALNSGQAQIVPINPATGTSHGNTYNVNVHLQGMFDFTRADTMRTFGTELRKVLQKLDKEVS